VAFDFPLRFPGQYFDRETALFYNYRRDLDPNLGTYLEADPLGLLTRPLLFWWRQYWRHYCTIEILMNIDKQFRRPLSIGFFSFLVALFGFFLALLVKDDKDSWIYVIGYLLTYIGVLTFIVAFFWLAVLALERWSEKSQ